MPVKRPQANLHLKSRQRGLSFMTILTSSPLSIGPNYIIYETSRNAMTLKQATQVLGPAKVWELYRQAKNGADALQARGDYHRDIKPSNILILEKVGPNGEIIYEPKIIDINFHTAGDYIENRGNGTTPGFSPTDPNYFETIMIKDKLVKERNMSPEAADVYLSNAHEAYTHARTAEDILNRTRGQMNLTPADQVALDAFYTARKNYIDDPQSNPAPVFPQTSSPALNNLGRLLDRAWRMEEIGDPGFIRTFNGAVDGVVAATSGTVKTERSRPAAKVEQPTVAGRPTGAEKPTGVEQPTAATRAPQRTPPPSADQPTVATRAPRRAPPPPQDQPAAQ